MAKPRLDGLLVSWNDERGFGFLRPADGSADLFVHISSFGAMNGRPEVGDIVSYRAGTGKNGRPQALDVHGPRRQMRQPGRAGPASLAVVAAFIVGYLAINAAYPIPLLIAGIYVVASLITFATYAYDKSRARSGGWRVPEATLLLLGLLCGWPGAILAQQVLRHKTQKVTFRSAFWVTVALNLMVFVVVAVPAVRGFLGA